MANYLLRIAIMVGLLLLVGLACNAERDEYLNQMAEFTVEFGFDDEKNGVLLREIDKIKPPWTHPSEELRRHEQYVLAHWLFHIASVDMQEIYDEVITALEPYKTDYPDYETFGCIFGHAGDYGTWFPAQEDRPFLEALGIDVAGIYRTCGYYTRSMALLVSLSHEADFGWLEKAIRPLYDKQYEQLRGGSSE